MRHFFYSRLITSSASDHRALSCNFRLALHVSKRTCSQGDTHLGCYQFLVRTSTGRHHHDQMTKRYWSTQLSYHPEQISASRQRTLRRTKRSIKCTLQLAEIALPWPPREPMLRNNVHRPITSAQGPLPIKSTDYLRDTKDSRFWIG